MAKYRQHHLKQSTRRIFKSSSDDISCAAASEVMLRLPQPVTIADLAILDPQLHAHLQTCSDCMGEFELFLTLYNEADIESAVQTIEIPPLPNQTSWQERLNDLIESILPFPGFRVLNLAATRGNRNGFDQVDLELNKQLTLEIDPNANDNDPSKWDIFLTLFSDEPQPAEKFNQITAQLIYTESGELIGETGFDELGDAFFRCLSAEEPYDLILSFEEERFRIQAITLPTL